jgi:hypothetical protein
MSATIWVVVLVAFAGLIFFMTSQAKANAINTPASQQAGTLGRAIAQGVTLLAGKIAAPSSSPPNGIQSINTSSPVYGQGYIYGSSDGALTLNAGSAADTAQISPGSED